MFSRDTGKFAADKLTLFAGNTSKSVSLCPDDRLTVECICPFFMHFPNAISIFCLPSLSLGINAPFNFSEKAEFCS